MQELGIVSAGPAAWFRRCPVRVRKISLESGGAQTGSGSVLY